MHPNSRMIKDVMLKQFYQAARELALALLQDHNVQHPEGTAVMLRRIAEGAADLRIVIELVGEWNDEQKGVVQTPIVSVEVVPRNGEEKPSLIGIVSEGNILYPPQDDVVQ